MSLWAVHHVKVTLYYCSATVSITLFNGDISRKYGSQLISADHRLTQSAKIIPWAEMIPWAVHHVEAVSTCQTDGVLLAVSV